MSMSLSWKERARARLAATGAPRVFTRDALLSWLSDFPDAPSQRTMLRALQEWETEGVVGRPAWGVYLNRQTQPLPVLEEAAQVLRPGAIVSLASVLGRAGILNNPSYWVTSVLPSTAVKGPVDVEGEAGTVFRFAHMREDLVPGPGQDWSADALDERSLFPAATPEKALRDWVYLSSSARGAARWPLPALHDLDVDDLDHARLDRLAHRMGLVDPLAQLMDAIAADRARVRVHRSRCP
jgi:hypothetical protein